MKKLKRKKSTTSVEVKVIQDTTWEIMKRMIDDSTKENFYLNFNV